MPDTILIKLSPVVSTALEVIAGVYGNGDERKNKLESMGYNYRQIQNCVNDLLSVMNNYKV